MPVTRSRAQLYLPIFIMLLIGFTACTAIATEPVAHSVVETEPAPTTEPEPTATRKPRPTATSRPTLEVTEVSSADAAIAAFENNSLTVISDRSEPLQQDWFPGTVEVISFLACSGCNRSYVMRFDTQQNFNRAFEDYSFVGGFYVFGNGKRIILLISKDSSASSANKYGTAIGAD